MDLVKKLSIGLVCLGGVVAVHAQGVAVSEDAESEVLLKNKSTLTNTEPTVKESEASAVTELGVTDDVVLFSDNQLTKHGKVVQNPLYATDRRINYLAPVQEPVENRSRKKLTKISSAE